MPCIKPAKERQRRFLTGTRSSDPPASPFSACNTYRPRSLQKHRSRSALLQHRGFWGGPLGFQLSTRRANTESFLVVGSSFNRVRFVSASHAIYSSLLLLCTLSVSPSFRRGRWFCVRFLCHRTRWFAAVKDCVRHRRCCRSAHARPAAASCTLDHRRTCTVAPV